MKKISILIFILFLYACEAPYYMAPVNINYAYDQITWDDLKNATSYRVIIDEEIYDIYDNQTHLDVSHLEDGTYDIVVIAYYKEHIERSSNFTFTIDRVYEAPSNITISNNILTFDSNYLTTYELYIDDVFITTFTSKSIDLSSYINIHQIYNIYVNAIYIDTPYTSETYTLNTHIKLDLDQHLDYELRSTTPLSFSFDALDTISYILKNNETLNVSLYTQDETSLTFDPQIFFYPSYGLNTFEVYTESGYFIITIEVIENQRPHLLSSSSITYIPQNDISLTFNLLGGTFVKLDGNNITSTDYIVDDGNVTINASFIENILLEQPDRKTIILSYQLQKEQNGYTGLIFIYID